MRNRTCTEPYIRPSFTSIFASPVNGRESNHFIEDEERRIVVWLLEDSPVGLRLILVK